MALEGLCHRMTRPDGPPHQERRESGMFVCDLLHLNSRVRKGLYVWSFSESVGPKPLLPAQSFSICLRNLSLLLVDVDLTDRSPRMPSKCFKGRTVWLITRCIPSAHLHQHSRVYMWSHDTRNRPHNTYALFKRIWKSLGEPI